MKSVAEGEESMSWYARRRAGGSRALPPVLWVLGVLWGVGAFAAPGAQAAEPPIELDLRGVPLGTAVNAISIQSGAQILFVDREGTLPTRVVTLTAKPRSVEGALQLLCKAAECYWWKDADGIYLI